MPKMSMFYYIFMMLMFLIFFIIMNFKIHPITTILMILTNTILICWLMTLWQSNSLYSMLLFLIMISGLLIIFLYFSSLITNTQNKFSFNYLLMINFFMNMIYFLYIKFPIFNNKYPMNSYLEILPYSTINKEMFHNLFMIYLYPFNNITILCIMFLLVVMCSIIKMCTIKSSSLRKIS